MTKTKWISVTLSVLILNILLFGFGITIVHNAAKQSYYNMGSHSGRLSADVATFKRLREIVGTIPACTDDEMKVGKMVATAKPEVILAIATNTNLYRFCETK
jgi:hypothetical protein